MTAPDDRAAITSLLLDYGRLCDEGRFAELSLLFTDEAELWIGDEPAHGRAAVRDAIATRQTPDRRGRHTLAITDVRVDRRRRVGKRSTITRRLISRRLRATQNEDPRQQHRVTHRRDDFLSRGK